MVPAAYPTRWACPPRTSRSSAPAEALTRRRAGSDYTTITALARQLAKTFWAKIEKIDPGQQDLPSEPGGRRRLAPSRSRSHSLMGRRLARSCRTVAGSW
ncbi:hypothetical protein GCM10017687_60090 [Streptomyces echinatus]